MIDAPKFPLMAISRLRMATDGEGITTLAAAQGCPLRCRYCLNPQCFDRENARCVTAEELYAHVKIDDLYFRATGGGISFGGGEPLLHGDFIASFRKICGTEWKLYAETCLNIPEEQLITAASVLNGLIVDIKDLNPSIYLAYTGKSVAQLLTNLKTLVAMKDPKDILIRVPLIPEYNSLEDTRFSLRQLQKMGFTRFDRFTYRT